MTSAWIATLVLASAPALPLSLVQDAPTPSSQVARPAEWRIDPGHTLIWGGTAYTPFGARIAGTVAEVERVANLGVRDVMVELPADGTGWTEVLRTLEARQMRYLVAVNSLAPLCRGVVVEPESYRVPGISAKRTIDARLPGADRALLVLASQRDGTVTETQVVTVREGFFSATVDPGNDLPHVLLVYPLQADLRTPDLWEGFDRHRDQLLLTLRRHPAGPGLRGVVNPMGRLLRFPSSDTRVVPVGTAFRLELEAYLRQRYPSVATAARSWGIPAPDFDSFRAMARLVPLWSETRGVTQFWDPENGRLFNAENRRGTAWTDLQEVLGRASSRRYARLVESIQQSWNVPVLQEWQGWAGPYANPTVGLNGLTLGVPGSTPAQVAEQAGPAVATALRRRQPLWVIADSLGSSEPDRWPEQVTDTAALGVRGWFTRNTTATSAQWQAAQSAVPAPSRLADRLPVVSYPESARNPVQTMNLGGFWLLPSPDPGNRIDYGDAFSGYRISDGVRTQTVLWSTQGPKKTVLRLLEPNRATVTRLDGSAVPELRVTRKGLQLTLTNEPIVVLAGDDIPVPEEAFVEVGDRLRAMLTVAERRLPTGGEEWVIFRDRVSQFEQSPGEAFLSLRQQFRRLSLALGSLIWIEAEATRDHTWSEVEQDSGTSQAAILRLASRLDVPGAVFQATYRLRPRQSGSHTVWVSASLADPSLRPRLRVRVGDQSVGAEADPVGFYGNGYAWYRLGDVELRNLDETLTLEVLGGGPGVEVKVDAIVLTPDPWRPDGVYPPAPIVPPGR